jgi:hypothetical protein
LQNKFCDFFFNVASFLISRLMHKIFLRYLIRFVHGVTLESVAFRFLPAILGEKSKWYIFKNFFKTPLLCKNLGEEQKKGFHNFFPHNRTYVITSPILLFRDYSLFEPTQCYYLTSSAYVLRACNDTFFAGITFRREYII